MCTDAELQFLQDVLVWPGDDQSPGYVNLHTNAPNNDAAKNKGKPWVIGWPYKTIADFTNRANWIAGGKSPYFNTWMCMSQQSEVGKSKTTGKIKAVRLAEKATWVKALWVDIDVKVRPATWDTDPETAGKPWTNYETFAEALKALSVFVKKVGLPTPSVVNSGGGLHCYWPSAEPLTPDEWYPYADGLKALLIREKIKCDLSVTTDVARLLRVPGTLNHKYDPPQKVALLRHSTPYSFPVHLPFLKDFKTGNTRPATKSPDVFGNSGPDPAFAALNPQSDSLQAGLNTTPKLIDATPIFTKETGCPWLIEALETGGKEFDNPQWHLSVVCASFMENGNDIAHQISQGHATYSEDHTQAEYDRAVADRAERGLGYPSCAAIASAGSKSCAGCPLSAKGKSPLNIRPVVTAKVSSSTAHVSRVVLPDDYATDDDGRIVLREEKYNNKGELQKVVDHLIFHNKVSDALVFKGPDTIRLKISHDLGNEQWAQFALTDVVGVGAETAMVQQGLLPGPDNSKVKQFFMSFMAKMWAVQAARPVAKFGWYRPSGPIEGFSCGGTLFKVNGQHEPSGISDRQMLDRYTPIGTVAQWHNTASYVFRQERPDFEAIIALAFAAPLMELAGTRGAILASMGAKGAGKSYALAVSAAVWGHPTTTVEGKKSTERGLMDKMGKTNGLPAFWNEVSDIPIQTKMLGIVQDVDGGADPTRLTPGIKQQVRNTWHTAININGNKSFREFIVTKQKDHGAGLRRVLEYWVPKNVANPVGQVEASEADAALGNLDYNYGSVGVEYAQYLVEHIDEVRQTLKDNQAMLIAALRPEKDENMWMSLCACLITGAQLATKLPTSVPFNVSRLTEFLIKVFLDNREFAVQSLTSPTQAEYADDYLGQYLKDRLMNTIWTVTKPHKAGRPAETIYEKYQPHVTLVGGVHVQWDHASKTLRFSSPDFDRWCQLVPEQRNKGAILASLKKHYGLKKDKKTLGAGTDVRNTQEHIFVIDVTGHADLEAVMYMRNPGGFTATVAEAAE